MAGSQNPLGNGFRLTLVALVAIALSGLTAPAKPALAAAGCISTADCLSKMTLAEKGPS